MTHIDPSWCARINAHRRPTEPQPETPPPPPRAAEAPQAATPTHGSPYRHPAVPEKHVCECCGTVMFDQNCKIVCPNCGYKRDCSDP